MLSELLRSAICLKCKKRLNTPGDVIKHIKMHFYEIVEEKVTPEWIKAINGFFAYLEEKGLI